MQKPALLKSQFDVSNKYSLTKLKTPMYYLKTFKIKKSYYKIVVLILIISFTINCKKEVQSEDNSTLINEIISNCEKEVRLNNDKYNVNNEKEILNELILNNNFILNEDEKEINAKLNESNNYFKNVYTSNNTLIDSTIKKLDSISFSKKNIDRKDIQQIEVIKIKLNKLDSLLFKYYTDTSLIISKMHDILFLKKDCKNEIEKNQIFFYSDECLNDYNNLVLEIQNLQIETSKTRTQIINFN